MVKRFKTTAKQRQRVRNSSHISLRGATKIVQTELKAEIAKRAEALVRPVGRPVGSKAFQSVMRAKELMAESSTLAVRLIKKAAAVAAAKGDSAPAEFLLKHTSAQDEKGKQIRPVATSVDKLEGDSGSRMPTINIGWIAAPAPVPAFPIIDVKALPAHESDS
jgi:hypothetical protein